MDKVTKWGALSAFLMFGLAGCAAEQGGSSVSSASSSFTPTEHYRVQTPTDDLHSFANTNQVSTPHLHLELDVDFESQTLSGFAEYDIAYKADSVEHIIFDTD